jgi:2,3-bisphosphoglycerate-independent phosphoglycerate mutase
LRGDKAAAAGKAVTSWAALAGGVHSHEDHIMAMVELAASAVQKNLSARLPGWPRYATTQRKGPESFEEICRTGQRPRRSIIGRYYAMDRDNRWDRVEQAYDLMTLAKGEFQFRLPLKPWPHTHVMKTMNS